MYRIDATGKTIGRISSEAAHVLMGKNTPKFVRNKIVGDTVVIENASKALITPKRRATSTYKRYSGYPGGLKTETMDQVLAKKGYAEVFEHAVYGMLPGNKLRKQMLKNLTITD